MTGEEKKMSFLEALKKGNQNKLYTCNMCNKPNICDKKYDIYEIETKRDKNINSSTKYIYNKSLLPICNKCIKTVIACKYCNKKIFKDSLRHMYSGYKDDVLELCKECFDKNACSTCYSKKDGVCNYCEIEYNI